MKIPKTLQKILDENENELRIFELRFHYQGILLKRRGYSIVKNVVVKYIDGYFYYPVIVELEPKYFGKMKWYLSAVPRNYPDTMGRYFYKISKRMFRDIDLTSTSSHLFKY